MTRVTIRSPKVSGRMALSSASVRPMGSSSSSSSSMSHGTAIPGLRTSDLYSGKKKPPSGAPTGCEPANAPMRAFRSLNSAATFEGLCVSQNWKKEPWDLVRRATASYFHSNRYDTQSQPRIKIHLDFFTSTAGLRSSPQSNSGMLSSCQSTSKSTNLSKPLRLCVCR